MATPYNHKAIEKKWRENWEKNPVNVKEDENGKREIPISVLIQICQYYKVSSDYILGLAKKKK